MHSQYGDSEFTVMELEYYTFVITALILGVSHRLAGNRIGTEYSSGDSLLLHLMPPLLRFAFFGMVGLSRMILALLIAVNR